MAENFFNILSKIEKKVINSPSIKGLFKKFTEKISTLQNIGFKELGIIENLIEGQHIDYVMVMANEEKSIDLMITDDGAITFGTLFCDYSVLDSSNYKGPGKVCEKFECYGYPSKNIEEIYEIHIKSINNRSLQPLSNHLKTIEEWLMEFKKIIMKFTEI